MPLADGQSRVAVWVRIPPGKEARASWSAKRRSMKIIGSRTSCHQCVNTIGSVLSAITTKVSEAYVIKHGQNDMQFLVRELPSFPATICAGTSSLACLCCIGRGVPLT